MLVGLLIGLLLGFLLAGLLFYVCWYYRPRYVSTWASSRIPKKGIDTVDTLQLPQMPGKDTEPMAPVSPAKPVSLTGTKVYKTGAMMKLWNRSHQTPEGWLL
jgi:hypothetical protein